MKYIFVCVFVAVFVLFDERWGYSHDSPLYTHLTYMFQHAGVLHLAVNSLAFIGMFHSLRKFVRKRVIVPVIILCGFAASFLSARDIPTVGASSMIYAMVGIYVGITLFRTSVKIADTRKYLLFLSFVAFGLSASLFNPNSNLLVHLYSLGLGFAAGSVIAVIPANRPLP